MPRTEWPLESPLPTAPGLKTFVVIYFSGAHEPRCFSSFCHPTNATDVAFSLSFVYLKTQVHPVFETHQLIRPVTPGLKTHHQVQFSVITKILAGDDGGLTPLMGYSWCISYPAVTGNKLIIEISLFWYIVLFSLSVCVWLHINSCWLFNANSCLHTHTYIYIYIYIYIWVVSEQVFGNIIFNRARAILIAHS